MPHDIDIFSPDTLWAMAPRALQSALRRLDGHRLGATDGFVGSDEALQAAVTGRNIQVLAETRTAGVWNGVAVIPVRGMIRPQHGFLSGTSLRSLGSDITAALDSKEVDAIVLDIDSPGGQTTALDEISDMIYGARGQKPIIAHCGGGMVASAALWIASACDEVVLSRLAEIGCIGVVGTYVDWTAFDDRVGIKEIEIVSSQSPNKRPNPATDEGRAQIQVRIDALADVFIDHVARNYGVSRDHVIAEFGQGDLVIGEAAVAVGLANRLSSFDDLMGGLASAHRTSSAFPTGIGASQMPRQQEGAPTAPEMSANTITAESLRASHPDIVQSLIDEGRQAGAEQERARIAGIQELSFEGLEEFVTSAALDPEQTPEKVAMECMRKIKAGEVSPRASADLEAPLGADPGAAEGQGQGEKVIDINGVYAHMNRPRGA